ncbi:type II toxin-antitoxin system RelE/ParE family toxin [Halomonas sp. HK25]|uniref:type II toxin-antitoxin system RelE/ParE family toxin n=1 Tax=Halomonas sp. HK25 TaxID=3394321 RepID=UPI0039FB9261
MPQVIFASAAVRDLERLREFLRPKTPAAAERTAKAMINGIHELGNFPHIGRPIDDLPEQYRDWLIDFGDSGYAVRYRLDGDAVVVLAVRHQREAGFG